MECGLKRKLDCIADMEVLIHSHADPIELDEQTKKMRLSVQLTTSNGSEGMNGNQGLNDWIGWNDSRSHHQHHHNHQHPCMETELDDKSDLHDDIPTTSEVINSLRKVILWMNAQGDQNDDYIQYLSEVEKYAKSKQHDVAQQRKITQYLIRRNH